MDTDRYVYNSYGDTLVYVLKPFPNDTNYDNCLPPYDDRTVQITWSEYLNYTLDNYYTIIDYQLHKEKLEIKMRDSISEKRLKLIKCKKNYSSLHIFRFPQLFTKKIKEKKIDLDILSFDEILNFKI
jgi:hypothetical protein